jgi:hypothetical protein
VAKGFDRQGKVGFLTSFPQWISTLLKEFQACRKRHEGQTLGSKKYA